MSDSICEVQAAREIPKCLSDYYTEMLIKFGAQYVEDLERKGIFEVAQQIDAARAHIQAKTEEGRLTLRFIESHIYFIASYKNKVKMNNANN